jgi:hypothetical protein
MLEETLNCCEDGVLCENETMKDTIWKIREGISMATAANGMTIKFDVSVDSTKFAEIIDKT